MAQTWQPKAPTEVVERRWSVPLAEGDAISGVATSATGVTVDSDDYHLGDAIVVLSGGAADDVAVVTLTVITSDGHTHVETFIVAIKETTRQFSYTLRDICSFALRKIVGNGVDAESTETSDAAERFNDMVALWRIEGLDIGIPDPLALGDTVEVADEYIAALKFNLRVACHSHYEVDISAYDDDMAETTKRLISNKLLELSDLSFATTLSSRSDAVEPI